MTFAGMRLLQPRGYETIRVCFVDWGRLVLARDSFDGIVALDVLDHSAVDESPSGSVISVLPLFASRSLLRMLLFALLVPVVDESQAAEGAIVAI